MPSINVTKTVGYGVVQEPYDPPVGLTKAVAYAVMQERDLSGDLKQINAADKPIWKTTHAEFGEMYVDVPPGAGGLYTFVGLRPDDSFFDFEHTLAEGEAQVVPLTGDVVRAQGYAGSLTAAEITWVKDLLAAEIIELEGSGDWEVPETGEYDILLVAGGASGGGGGSSSGGGGGAGGRKFLEGVPLTQGQSIPYSIGAGGPAISGTNPGNPGGDTTFGSDTVIGGGRGGSWDNPGGDGGSGGGAGGRAASPTSVPGAGTEGQGNDGGEGTDNRSDNAGGGGGGATEPGGDADGDYSGKGGDGDYFGSIFGDWHGDDGWFAAGASGGFHDPVQAGDPGKGGGGRGGNDDQPATPGKPKTGSGGGGSADGADSAAGGSGTILIRYIPPEE